MTVEERRALVARRDRERVRRADRERAKEPKRQAVAVENTRKWRARHPDRWTAQKAVAAALRSGTLVKGPCEQVAKGDCNGPVHAHHDDYSKPLEVRWLCGRHHHEHHAAERSGA